MDPKAHKNWIDTLIHPSFLLAVAVCSGFPQLVSLPGLSPYTILRHYCQISLPKLPMELCHFLFQTFQFSITY